ncbi:cation transporter HKT4 isoform X1 [Selaginella moellendorffii]|uniref:cation transporter HKT4 isoform X1 n=1 Tax=Selaginella moellendorffii TaxID=88036 RepID=UPI000D1CCD30|nr:cation transporter HKT4 isoform X1 [Selaginella moellendorffii]|eukprot:XP_024533120.1 cation transporter HKT4 isoform X1 [Selaginella moellendorffii]
MNSFKDCHDTQLGRNTRNFLQQHMTFFRVHLTCFVIVAFIGSLILWGIGNEREDIPPGGQVVLMIMMLLGSQVVTSTVPLLVKKHRYCRVARIAIDPSDHEPVGPPTPPIVEVLVPETFSRSEPRVEELQHASSKWSMVAKRGSQVLEKLGSKIKRRAEDEAWMAEMATKRQAEHLTEVFQEHQATIVLIRIIVIYGVLVHLMGFFIAWLSILCGRPYPRNLIRHKKKTNLGFFSLFAVVSAFCNVGYIASSENLMPFNSSLVLLLDMILLIMLGNGIYPPCLRGIIRLLHHFSKGNTKQACEFLLDHPRKCYTHLFPPNTTRWLLISFFGLNGFEICVIYILDWNSTAFDGLDTGEKIVNGIFQCVNTRSGGMNSVAITGLSPTTLFIFAVMMYVSAYPVFLSRQATRQKSVDDEGAISHLSARKQRDILDTTLATQFRRLLAQDTAYLFLATFFICVSVNHGLKHDPLNYNIFSVVFEIISAYGGVGLSYGYSCSLRTEPGYCVDEPVSFSGKWGVTPKIIMIVVMLLGRHRGLPDNIDSAILLPEQKFSNIMRRQTSE